MVKLDEVIAHKETVFNEEAKWYKALNLVGLKMDSEAKIVLQEIIDDNQFYKKQAEEKLKELE